MKFIGAILLLAASVALAAEYPTALEIAQDFQKTYDYYNLEATKFVEKLASVLDQRSLSYVGAHQKLILHFTNIRLIPSLQLNANSEQILAKITTRIQEMMLNIPKVLDRNIFSNELKKHMDILKTGYLSEAENAITELGKYVTKYPAIGKCWQENRDEIFKIVENGFKAARDAAITTVSSANTTLNTNEFLIDSLIAADNSFIEICKTIDLNGCIASYLNVADIIFPTSSSIWESTTNTTIGINLQVSESMIKTATQISVIQITQVVYKIENCVKAVISQPKS